LYIAYVEMITVIHLGISSIEIAVICAYVFSPSFEDVTSENACTVQLPFVFQAVKFI